MTDQIHDASSRCSLVVYRFYASPRRIQPLRLFSFPGLGMTHWGRVCRVGVGKTFRPVPKPILGWYRISRLCRPIRECRMNEIFADERLTLEQWRATARLKMSALPQADPGLSLSSRWQPTVDEDSLLIERTLSGDRSAFSDLVTKYQDRLYSSMLG